MKFVFVWCFSYGGELTRLGGLAHLGEISPSLTNSYKNINVLLWESSQPRLGEISLYFDQIPPRRDENFPNEHAQVGQPGKVDRVFFNQLCLIIKTYALHDGFTSLFTVKNYLIKQSFFSDITNFFIELRKKIPYERGIKIISPRQASRLIGPAHLYINSPLPGNVKTSSYFNEQKIWWKLFQSYLWKSS